MHIHIRPKLSKAAAVMMKLLSHPKWEEKEANRFQWPFKNGGLEEKEPTQPDKRYKSKR